MSAEIIFLALSIILLGASSLIFARTLNRPAPLDAAPTRPERLLDAALEEALRRLDIRVEKLEREQKGWLEQMEERIDRGNKVYQRARAAERRLEEQRELEGLYESETGVPESDGEGGPGEGVPHMPEPLEASGDSRPLHLQLADEVAQQALLGWRGAFE